MYRLPLAERLLWLCSALSFCPGQVPTQEVSCAAEGNVLACAPTSAITCCAESAPNPRKKTLRTVTRYHPSRRDGWFTFLGSKRRFQVTLVNGLDSSRAQTAFTVPHRIHPTAARSIRFSSLWVGRRPI